MSKRELESDLADDIREYAIKRGWLTFKVESPSINGIPDRFFARRGRVIFAELKNPNGKGVLSEQQKRRIKDLHDHGVEAYVWDNLEEAKAILK